jgi:peptidyl-prolyl cis-trans isomerase A (cyclophilin A)
VRNWVVRCGGAGVALACATMTGCGHPRPHPSVVAVDSTASLDQPAPDSFMVAMETSRGRVDLLLHRDWAPNGVDRVYHLIAEHYFDQARIYRVVPGFVAQFGLAADSATTATWKRRRIPDDSVIASNLRGAVSFASGGPGTRTTQLFINLVDNTRLDGGNSGGYPPIGRVVSGMERVDQFNGEYNGTMPGRAQDSISRQGNAYLRRMFPRLDFIKTVTVTRKWQHH